MIEMRPEGTSWRVMMDAGDYGLPIPFQVTSCCGSEEELDSGDLFRLTISRGGEELVRREMTWAELAAETGCFVAELTEEESRRLTPGRYGWTMELIREGTARNTLTSGVFFVRACRYGQKM